MRASPHLPAKLIDVSIEQANQICDGLIDCDDTSDELNCSNCTETAFQCKEAIDFQVCIPGSCL